MKLNISCNCKCKFNSATCNSNQKQNIETCQWECKNYRTCKIDNDRNPRICIYENSKYLKSIAYSSVFKCDEIISVMDIVSTRMTNNIATNVPTNYDDKK